MKTIRSISLIAVILVGTALVAARAAEDDKLKEETKAAIEAFQKADSGLKKQFDSAVGYAVFPSVGKGGLIIGGARGKGLVYEKGKLIGRATLSQVTVGAQIGGQDFSEVIFFENQAALDQFKKSEFAMSAQVSAVAAAEGASKNAKYVEGVMIFTKARTGLMAEASIGGQKFKYEEIK